MANIESPYFPIIYVRGYAMTESAISETVSTPYMGFNIGSTKIRQSWDGAVKRHVFESPLIRLMKEYSYIDSYSNGEEISDHIPSKSVVIYRYYDPADRDLGNGRCLSIFDAAVGLRSLIYNIRKMVCGGEKELEEKFKVYLVAHSMGGLVCRCLIQNDGINDGTIRKLISKVFTYATPHNGIDMARINVPSFLKLWDMNNFNRNNIKEYLSLPDNEKANSLGDKEFNVDDFFCLVGTNNKDYKVANGLSSLFAGEMSDGLVRIENATVEKSPRAFVHKSHSGAYGIVNSEEGYQNLVRFFFGDYRADGELAVEALPLPPSIHAEKNQGKTIKASYYFEAAVATRGSFDCFLTERRRSNNSAIIRQYSELFGNENNRNPKLFSIFLDSKKITTGDSLKFGVELSISTTGYTVNGVLNTTRHIEGEYLYRDTISIEIKNKDNSTSLQYVFTGAESSESPGSIAVVNNLGKYQIPLKTERGFKAELILSLHPRQAA